MPMMTMFDKQIARSAWVRPTCGAGSTTSCRCSTDDDPLGVDDFATTMLRWSDAPRRTRCSKASSDGAIKVVFSPDLTSVLTKLWIRSTCRPDSHETPGDAAHRSLCVIMVKLRRRTCALGHVGTVHDPPCETLSTRSGGQQGGPGWSTCRLSVRCPQASRCVDVGCRDGHGRRRCCRRRRQRPPQRLQRAAPVASGTVLGSSVSADPADGYLVQYGTAAGMDATLDELDDGGISARGGVVHRDVRRNGRRRCGAGGRAA